MLPEILQTGTSRYVFRQSAPLPQLPIPVWQHKHDYDLEGQGRPITQIEGNGTPEVFRFLSETMEINKQWQYYLIAINPGMQLQHISALLNSTKAFCNNANGVDAGRANFILGENLSAALPKFSAVWVCGGSIMTGTVTGGTHLAVHTMDGNHNPPLKLDRSYPQSIGEINQDDYLFTPKTTPWMFFSAVDVYPSGKALPFAHGGFYPWTPDTGFAYSFLPYVSRFPVVYPLERLRPVSRWVSPYLIV